VAGVWTPTDVLVKGSGILNTFGLHRKYVKAIKVRRSNLARMADLGLGASAGLDEAVRASLKRVGISRLTPVQEESLPHLLAGKDCLAKAKTGTGKTLAFLMPTLHRLLRNAGRMPVDEGVDPIRALVLSSTRELALQIVTQAERLCEDLPLNLEIILGGTAINPQRERLDSSILRRSAAYGGTIDLMIATPGRLAEHIRETSGFTDRLAGCEVLVLDEVRRGGAEAGCSIPSRSCLLEELLIVTPFLGGLLVGRRLPARDRKRHLVFAEDAADALLFSDGAEED
jgi:superfamily II DNA/RNA helicase